MPLDPHPRDVNGEKSATRNAPRLKQDVCQRAVTETGHGLPGSALRVVRCGTARPHRRDSVDPDHHFTHMAAMATQLLALVPPQPLAPLLHHGNLHVTMLLQSCSERSARVEPGSYSGQARAAVRGHVGSTQGRCGLRKVAQHSRLNGLPETGQHAKKHNAAMPFFSCVSGCTGRVPNRPFRWSIAVLALLLVACAAKPPQPPGPQPKADAFALANRLSWGANTSVVAQFSKQGLQAHLQSQLHPSVRKLAGEPQAQIDAMTISKVPLVDLVQQLEQQRKDADAMVQDDAKKAAQQAYQQELNRLQREATARHLLRALYSPNQVQEQMTWFWMNHFSVHQGKGNLRAMLGDYEETAIRTHALGRFRDLLGAVASHPAMLRYLDNDQNATGRINENYARELMELHTLGVDAGYTQRDVQELARVLTGVGINLGTSNPALKKELQPYYLRRGLFEFNPARHDFGDKVLLGKPIKGRGMDEVNEALDRLVAQPASARFISRKLAHYWVSDEPPTALVERMAQRFEASHGDIAATLEALFTAPEFAAASGRKFKDPMRYVVSAVRLAYDDKAVLNVGPMINWLNRMGEPLYGRVTPDGYPLAASAWNSPGQMATRFEIAKAIGSGSAGLFKSDGPQSVERSAFPQLSNALYYQSIAQTLSPATVRALDQAASPQEWNSFLLSSPEMMYR